MGTKLNSEFGEAFAEKNDYLESEVDQTTDNQENESDSEPEIYFLFSHRGRKHDPRGDKRIGLFGPFSPRGPKGFGFPFHDEPHRIGRHPHERPHGGVDRNDGRRRFRHGPHMRYPERDGSTEAIEGERGHSPHRGMRRFGPGPHGKRGSSSERDSEHHREPRHHGDPSRRPRSFGPREHGHGPRNNSRGRSETEEHIHSPSYHLPREHRRRPRGGPRDRFETEEQTHLPREHGHRHRGGPRDRFETEEQTHLPREHGHRHRGSPRDRFETEEQIHHPREHGHKHRGGPHDEFEFEEFIHHLFREHDHDYHHRGHGIGPRGRFEAEENAKYGPNGNSKSHKYGHGPHRRFEAEGSGKEFHGKHERRGRHPSLGNEHGRRGERGPRGGSPSRGYFSDNSEHRGPHGHGFGPRGNRRFEHGRHRPDAEHKTRHHRGGHEFERARNEPESHYMRETFGNHRDDFNLRGRHRLGNGRPRLQRHVPRHRIHRGPRFPHRYPHRHPHRHPSKPLTPEELAEKVALLNSMGFPPENNTHYEELLKKFNGRIGRVVEILLWEQKKDKGKDKENDDENDGNEEDSGKDEDEGGDENEENGGESNKTPESYDIVDDKQ